jgi:hypothetical protein
MRPARRAPRHNARRARPNCATARAAFDAQESDGVVSASFAMVPPACLLFPQVGVYAWQEAD